MIAVVQADEPHVVSVEIQSRGFVDDEDVFADVEPQIVANLGHALIDGVSDTYLLQQNIRRTIGRWVATTLHSRPMILPIVVQT